MLMNKTLRYSFVALMAMFMGTAFADEFKVTFKEAGGSSDSSTKQTTIDGLVAEGGSIFSAVEADNVYQAREGRGVKLGSGSKPGSMVFTLSPTIKISTIKFTARKYNDTELAITVNGKDFTELDGDFKEYTVELDGSEVDKISITTPEKRAYITTMTIIGEATGNTTPDPNPNPGDNTNYGTADAPLTVAEAIAIANAAGSTATTADVYTKGVVTKITTAWNSQYNNVSFNISDDGGTTTLAVFRCKSEAEDYVLEGDEVIIKGKLKMYNDTPEYDAGCEIVSLKQGSAHGQAVTTPTADNIAAFIAMETGQKVILTLTNAQVIGAGNKYIVVKDATGSLNLYGTGLEFTLGQILNGTITGQTAEYKTIKQLSNMSENTLTATDGTITATIATVAEAAAAENLTGVLLIKNAVVQKDGNNFYIVDGDTKLQLYNQFRYEGMELAEGTFDIEGVVGYYNNKQFWPNKITAAEAGISSLNAEKANGAIYNLAGQRVDANYKGVVIQNGKKFVVK